MPSSFNASSLALPLTIFHNLILTNLSELVNDHLWQELWSSTSQDHFLHISANPHVLPVDSSPYPSFSIWSSIFGSWTAFDLWIAFCSILASLRIVKALFTLYLHSYYLGLSARLHGYFDNLRSVPCLAPTATIRPLPSIPDPLVTVPSPDIELACVKIDATSSWPPRATISPVNVLFLADRDRFFMTQIPIRVNGIRVLALIDTGASITITTVDSAPLFGAFHFTTSDVTSAVGMAGVPIHLLGYATLSFEIGTLSFDHPVYFTKAACIPDVADSYNIILGNDLLRRLPPWTIDYNSRTLVMAGQQVKILCANAADTPSTPDQLIPVRAAETTVLPPSAETFVRCHVDGHHEDSLVLTTQNDKLSAHSLLVTPAIINPANPVLLVANPSSQPFTLYHNQVVSTPLPLSEVGTSVLPTHTTCP
ncbi:hypothetical protein GCK32_000947 [Trichostrongylus colubriformis]|uniref:Peptidase A2 domain-containing protein n=1 Tax=Trichostrongylus colubriformis TaxID=6319 RepID=A0AAN8FQP1_TRICO